MSAKIITICGSSCFVDIMAICAWLIERDEHAIVMSLHLLPRWYFNKKFIADHLAEHEHCAAEMNELHLRKIDISDEIFMVNFDDYIGEDTTNEINYAMQKGKSIRWFTHDDIGRKVQEIISECTA